MRRAFLTGLLALGLIACATPGVAARYSGTFEFSFETAAFRTDEGSGPYWLAAEREVWREIQAPLLDAGAGPWGQTHLVVEGVLSPGGAYGHLGAYKRELRVTRVIDARLVSAQASYN